MNSMEIRFLEALRASLEQKALQWNTRISEQQWMEFYHQAEIQNVLPLIFETVYSCPAKQSISPTQQKLYRRKTLQDIMLQTMRTETFLRVETALREAGVTPLIIKGIICRSLYPMPDHRPSSDEDLLIPADQLALCHQVLLEQGMSLLHPEQDISAEVEVSYGMKDNPLHIQVHKQLFSPDSETYDELRAFFDGVWERAVEMPVNGTMMLTLGYTDQLLYLICHAFKHFLHSGFGLRQVCDITLFANRYGSQIDWTRVLICCRAIHAEHFAATLFRIGRSYLTFSPKQAHYPRQWRDLEMEELPILDDLFGSGIVGSRAIRREHSSTLTLHEVAAQKQRNRRRFPHPLRAVFSQAPDAKEHPYRERKPFLSPIAWGNRVTTHRKNATHAPDADMSKPMAVEDDRRLALMKKYGILK